MHCWDLDPNLLNPEKVSFIYIQFYTTFINKFSISVSDRICIISLILNCKELDLYFLYLFSLQQSTYLYHHQDLQYRFVSSSGSAEYKFVSPSGSAEYRFVSPQDLQSTDLFAIRICRIQICIPVRICSLLTYLFWIFL